MMSQKGTLVTRDAMEKRQKQFVLLSAMYPLLWMVARMDVLLPLQTGYKLIVQARRTDLGRMDGEPLRGEIEGRP